MKTTHKKLVGGLLISLLIVTIGAAIVTGATDDLADDTSDDTTTDTLLPMPFGGHRGMIGLGPFGYNLTDEQQTELENLMTSLRDQNATPDEIRTAIQQKLDEFGLLDIQLDNEIAQTQQRLTILNRQKELRDEGYSWDDIYSLIEEEFRENATGISWGVMSGFGCGRNLHGSPQDGMIPEESDQ